MTLGHFREQSKTEKLQQLINTFLCFVRFEQSANDLPHTLHEYGFSPVTEEQKKILKGWLKQKFYITEI